MATKNNPGRFDCYTKAEPDEPMFVLLARDPAAPEIIEEWIIRRAELGKHDKAQMDEARQCAKAMRKWYAENRAGK